MRLNVAGCLFASLVSLATSALVAAPPKLDSLFPAGAARGTTTKVAAAGTFATWPAKTWVDRPGLKIEPAAEKGQLNVTVELEAEAGVYWLRLADAEGATSPRPLVVGTLPELVEVEPNDAPSKPQPIAGSSIVNGRLQKSNDVDVFSLSLTKGQTLVASLLANRLLGSPCDGVLQICNPEGIVLAQNDDARGIDPEVVFAVPQDGKYLVRAFAFPTTPDSTIGFAGGDAFIYRLTVTTGAFVDHALPMAASRDAPTEVELFGWNLPDAAKKISLPAAGDREQVTLFHPLVANSLTVPVVSTRNIVAAESSDPAQPQDVELPVVISGRIKSPRDVDAFRFAAKKGAKLLAQVDSFDLGYPLDPLLQLTDATGKVLVEIDDTKKQRDADLAFTAPADGEYRLLIRDLHQHGGFRYAYRLAISETPPDFDLVLAADSFVLMPGKPLEIPITINRRGDLAGEIEVSAVGLPEGVAAQPVKSAGTGDTAKAVKLVVNSEKGPISGSFRIVGTSVVEPVLKKTAHYPLAAFNADLADVWLTVTMPPEKK